MAGPGPVSSVLPAPVPGQPGLPGGSPATHPAPVQRPASGAGAGGLQDGLRGGVRPQRGEGVLHRGRDPGLRGGKTVANC